MADNATSITTAPGKASRSHASLDLDPRKVIHRRAVIQARTGFSKTTLYELIKRGEFPAPVRITARAVGWIEAEVDAWMAQRVAASRRAA